MQRGSSNLREYLANATLPPLVLDPTSPPVPQGLHKSHINDLSVRGDRRRQLSTMYRLNPAAFYRAVVLYSRSQIPDFDLPFQDDDPVRGDGLSIPAMPAYSVPAYPLPMPSDAHGIRLSAMVLAGLTMSRVLHMIYPEQSRQYSLRADPTTHHPDDRLILFARWHLSATRDSRHGGAPRDTPATSKRGCIFAVQPPWILTEADMWWFSSCTKMPPVSLWDYIPTVPLTSRERLWAKLWDTCVRAKCPWFVLTNYNQWIFGVFSDAGWSTAFVSPVMYFDAKYPVTIIQTLVFWVVSAMGGAGGFSPPNVSEVTYDAPPVAPREIPETLNFSDSGSEWSVDRADLEAHYKSLTGMLTSNQEGVFGDILKTVPKGSNKVQQWITAQDGLSPVSVWEDGWSSPYYSHEPTPTHPLERNGDEEERITPYRVLLYNSTEGSDMGSSAPESAHTSDYQPSIATGASSRRASQLGEVIWPDSDEYAKFLASKARSGSR